MARFLNRMRSYRVSTVSRNGLLNFVNCDMTHAEPLAFLTPARVIQSFDLNCVRVGVDLATGRLVWDRHFENFLKYRRIEVCAMHTPWHTFLRAVKKCNELPDVTMHLEAIATIATTFADSDLFVDYSCNGVVGNRFGPKLRETAEKFRGTWSRYFSMEQWTYALAHEGKDFTASWLEPRSAADVSIQRRVDALHNASLHFAGPVLHSLFRKHSHKARALAYELDDALPGSGRLREYFEQNASGFASGHVSSQHVETVTQLLQRWPQFVHVFAALTLDEQFEASKMVSQLSRQIPAHRFNRFARHVQPSDLRQPKTLAEFEARVHAAASVPLGKTVLALPRVPTPLAARGMTLRELRSLEDFDLSPQFSSSSYMLEQVRKGTRAIIEISTPGPSKPVVSVMEVKLENGEPTVLSMIHRLPGREEPTPRVHRLMAAIVLARLTGSPLGKQSGPRGAGGPLEDVPF